MPPPTAGTGTASVAQTVTVNLTGTGNLPSQLNQANQSATQLWNTAQKFAASNALTRAGSRIASAFSAATGSQETLAGLNIARGMQKQATGLIGLANPWAVERSEKAVRDFGAVIGRDLVPHLDAATRIVRKAADAYANLSPITRNVIAGTVFWGGILAGSVLTLKGIAYIWGQITTGATTAWAALRGLNLALNQTATNATAAAVTQNASTMMYLGGGGGGQAASKPGWWSRKFGAVGGGIAAAGRWGLRALPFIGTGLLAYDIADGLGAFGGKNRASSFGAAVSDVTRTDGSGYLGMLQMDASKSNQSRSLEENTKALQELVEELKRGRTPVGMSEESKKALINTARGTLQINGGPMWHSVDGAVPWYKR